MHQPQPNTHSLVASTKPETQHAFCLLERHILGEQCHICNMCKAQPTNPARPVPSKVIALHYGIRGCVTRQVSHACPSCIYCFCKQHYRDTTPAEYHYACNTALYSHWELLANLTSIGTSRHSHKVSQPLPSHNQVHVLENRCVCAYYQ